MERQYRHFLLTVDESPDCLRPMRFLATLYPELRDVHVLLCHFYAPLAPIYRQPGLSPSMVAQKEALVSARQEHARAILDKARNAIIGLGVTAENVQLHTEERSVSEAQHSCSLASVTRVDGVLVPKTVGGKLDGFLRGDPIPAHLRHCLAKPVWFLEGAHIDTNQAVIGMVDQEASLRAARHAGSMLAGCGTRIDLVHCDAHMDWSIISEVAEPSTGLSAFIAPPDLNPFLADDLVEATIRRGADGRWSASGLTLLERPRTLLFGEVARLMKDALPKKVTVIWWDTRVCKVQEFSPEEYANIGTMLAPAGGGGTSPQCVVDYVKDKGLKFECAVWLTDGYIGKEPVGYTAPQLWGVIDHEEFNARTGKTLHISSMSI